MPTTTSTPRRQALGLAATAFLVTSLSSFAAACSAMSPAPVPPTAHAGNLVQVSVVDRASGQPLQVWARHGERYIAGAPGAAYAIRVTNRTSRRVLAIMSVDGVNVITGQTAGYAQSGYVLEPWQSADITGWRKSDSQVAAFGFTALSDSYAALTGRPTNIGVIGVAVFTERERPPRAPDIGAAQNGGRTRSDSPNGAAAGAMPSSPAAPAARAAEEADTAVAKRERLGTGHGAIEPSWSSTTAFERASSSPAELVAIRYDSFDNLVAAGVIPRRIEPASRPTPFPVARPGFVPDPPQQW